MKLAPCTPTREMWEMLNDPREPNFDDFGPQTFEQFAEELAGRKNFNLFAIEACGQVLGYIGYEMVSPVTMMFRGLVIDRAFRRQGFGRLAFASIISTLSRQGIEKFLVMPFAGNAPIDRFLNSLEFIQEGYLTGATKRHGEALDLRVFGKLVHVKHQEAA